MIDWLTMMPAALAAGSLAADSGAHDAERGPQRRFNDWPLFCAVGKS